MAKRGIHRGLVARLLLFTAGSFAFGFALVPLYSVLCKVWDTGNRWYGTQTAQASVIEQPDMDRVVTVEFVGSVAHQGDWEFAPTATTMKVHPGKLYEATFHAKNLTGHGVIAQAVPSIAPQAIARYFKKTQCFCFEPQKFATDEAREMPVRFIVDRDLPPDVDRITLSYSFFDLPQQAASSR
jgi:cytochrome c oxidase assembly protein subunit 11